MAIPVVPRLDLTGQVYSRLTVLSEAEPKRTPCGSVKRRWLCRCACGVLRVVMAGDLRSGKTLSCGCLQSEWSRSKLLANPMRQTTPPKHNWLRPEYGVWCAMRTRCTNPNFKDFKNYGGRGITICPEWDSFETFLSDVGERPSDKHSLDRIDNNGNYEPGNVRWADRTTQVNNRRVTVWLEWDGERKTLTQWAQAIGIRPATLANRLRSGWPLDRALTEGASK